MKTSWQNNDTLIDWSGNGDLWTIGDACEGVQVFGGSGSGKSSGALKTIAEAYLFNGFGGIVLCAKIDEADTWIKYAEDTGRSNDIIRLSETKFDFLQYESTRCENVEIDNIAKCFLEMAEVNNYGSSGGADEYFKKANEQLIKNTIALLLLSKQIISLNNIAKVIAEAPKSLEEIKEASGTKSKINPFSRKKEYTNNKSYTLSLFDKIDENNLKYFDVQNFEQARKYFLSEFPTQDPKTRGNIISTFTTLADSFLRGKINDIFCSGVIETTPEACGEGKIILVDLPVKDFQEVGKYAAVIVKYMTQRYLERRENKGNNVRPVFIFADESQFFTTSKDQEFQTTARSARGCTVYATQNVPNYLKELKQKATVDALLGNLQTKILCHNADSETNKWAAEMIGSEYKKIINTSTGSNQGGNSAITSSNKSISERKEHILPPESFTTLKRGGKAYNFKVSSYIWKGGFKWKNGKNNLLMIFNQKKINTKNSEKSTFSLLFSGFALVCLALLIYSMYKFEFPNIVYLFKKTHLGLYGQGLLIGLGLIFVWFICSYKVNLKLSFNLFGLLVLSANAYYIYTFSISDSIFLFSVNLFLILVLLCKGIIKKIINGSSPVIIK